METKSNSNNTKISEHSISLEDQEDNTSVGIPNNINASDIDNETRSKLKGDAIGDTLYSESFVLKTLIQFSDLKWSQQVEEDLCFLWDMTIEKDVCKYLFNMSYPSLACSAIIKYKESRFREIVIGILANIMCADCEKVITDDEINTILLELDNDDHLILIQVMRFLSAVAHNFNKLPYINEEIMQKIKFILNNSMNVELLINTLDACAKLTDLKLSEDLIDVELFMATLTSYRTIMEEEDGIISFDTKEKQQCCKCMLEIIKNICSYIESFENPELLVEIQKNANDYVKEVVKMLDFYSHEENLFPLSDDLIFYIDVIRYTLTTLNVGYTSTLLLNVSKIFCHILNVEDEVPELFDSVLEIECYLLSRELPDIILKDFMFLPRDKVKVVLNSVKQNVHKYDYGINIQKLLSKYK
ncbi:unnamed protein product [Callosobruchus maculatus]|uniref:Uncharacterized protein n=1 Tax=Callosobruchus maculatus TaxID=64391 RepID=A0A653CKF1_CALMS|nr:unnamed protein product [Callosobruchus maculatus]